ncbi:MAG TPA: methylenetetrahydrofolate reductase C-terminal domain-containing protein [Clostridiales bacterium]|nr:methylenetetrahydrofolate reductase C-terminal domain-containing protein [Clostridiales bacterium]
MIVAEQKPIEELISYIKDLSKIVIAACGTCVTVCMAGGEKEALKLASILKVKRLDENRHIDIKVVTPKRQCDDEFLEDIAFEFEDCEAILSLGCGAGIQFMAEKFKGKPVLPGVNTKFMGVTRDIGVWTEMCQGCGDCILEKTGGICPVTRCSKSNFNGPCGGSASGKCEIDPDTDCGWQLIYDRLKALGKLDNLYEIIPPKDWQSSRDGGPRKVIQKEVIL